MIRSNIHKLNKLYDVIIVGGGITGCAMAYEAASKGLNVILFEKDDFGHATSSATSKLIHGGLRYLKNFEFDLVRESLEERKVLGNITPNLVSPLRFIIPNYDESFLEKILLQTALFFYDVLSFDKNNVQLEDNKLPNHKTISLEEILKEEPTIKKENLQGAVAYYDYQNTNPTRMHMAFLLSAWEKGAIAMNYTAVKKIIKTTTNEVVGVEVYDSIENKSFSFLSKIVINCAGPWSDKVLSLTGKEKEEKGKIIRSEGVHLITKKLINKNALACQTDEGDHLLIIPWRDHTIIGTNDRAFKGNPDEYKVQKESIDEILNKANKYFSPVDKPLTYKDILYAYGGLRPLSEEADKDSYNTSRKYEIVDGEKIGLPGLITVKGGKYTTSRNLAETTISMLQKKGFTLTPFDTKKHKLVGCRINETETLLKKLKNRFTILFTDNTYLYYATLYAELAHHILELAEKDQKLRQTITHDGEILAEVKYVIQEEMPQTLLDILIRRTAIGDLGKPSKAVLALVANLASEEWNWDENRIQKELELVEAHYKLPV
ncbi:MAG: FAD-dependent oxidoreductase [Solirubrobacteraceae bacterium]